MNSAELRKKLLPHVIIVAIFIILSCVYLSPALSGKVLQQNDVRQWKGSYQEIKDYYEKTGERTLWTNSMFGGMPTYQISPYSPNSMIGTIYIYNVLVSGWSLPVPINAVFLYCFSFYLLLLAFRVKPWLAMIGGIAYGFGSFNIIILEAGHVLQAYALGTAPLVLAAAVFTIREKKYFLGGALFALALAIHIRTSHIQMSYYTGILLGIYLIGEFIYHLRHKQLAPYFKSIGVFAIATAIAIGSSITLQLTTYEYGKETIRGQSELKKSAAKSSGLDVNYAFEHSYGVGETFSLMIPNIRGGSSGAIGEKDKSAADKNSDEMTKQIVESFDSYWGSQSFTSGPFYIGAIICFLFILGLVFLKGNDKWWILAATVLSMMLAWGKNFEDFNMFFFNHFPLYNKFRSVDFTLVIAAMAMPILAMLVLNKLLTTKPAWDKETRKKFFIALGIAGGLCLIFFLAPTIAGDMHKPEDSGETDEQVLQMMLQQSNVSQQEIAQFMKSPAKDNAMSAIADARADILKADAGRSLIFILLAGGILVAFFMGKLKKEYVIVGIAVLVVADLFTVDKRYLNNKNFATKHDFNADFDPTEADNTILQDKDPDYRVLNLTKNVFNDATVSYFHKSIGGYHGAKLRRFQEFREHYLDQPVGILQQNVGRMSSDTLLALLQKDNKLVGLNLLNDKYMISGPGANNVIRNPYALGHAWFVNNVSVVPDADSEMSAVGHIDPKTTAVTDKRYADYLKGFNPQPDPAATITLEEYRPNRLKYKTNATSEQFAVFSEVYYDSHLGWNAYVDGKKVDHIRVDYLLRGMRIPAGQHTIDFKFEPESFAKGEIITLISSLLLLFGVIGAVVYEVMKARKHNNGGQVQTA
jgi:hypothetical protein